MPARRTSRPRKRRAPDPRPRPFAELPTARAGSPAPWDSWAGQDSGVTPAPTPPGSSRLDLVIVLALASAIVATRLPLRTEWLTSWDAIQFALAVHDYDIVKHQPHPPGYILYVALARLIDGVVGDPTASLTLLAILASVATVGLTYRLARTLYGRPTAVTAAVALVASPLFWYHGLVGLSYAAEAALAVLVASLAWEMRHGRPRTTLWAALALGLAGGVRQSLLIVLGPLWLGLAWRSFRRAGPILAGSTVIAATTALWFVPMVWLTGGLDRYLEAGRELYESTVRATTVMGAPGHWQVNVERIVEAAAFGLGLLLPALALPLVTGLPRVAATESRGWLFALWMGPPLAVYTFVHFGQYGYLLTVLPALAILAAHAAVGALEQLVASRWRPAALGVGLTTVVLAHGVFFVASPPIDVTPPPNQPAEVERWGASARTRYRYGLWMMTVGGLREQEAVIRTYVETVRRRFDPADTVLVTELGNPRSAPWFRHVSYYLPEFTVYHLRTGRFSPGYLTSPAPTMAALGGPEIFLPPRARRLVWVVDFWDPTQPEPLGIRVHALAYGRWLYVLDLGRRPVDHAGYRLTPVMAVSRLR